MQPMFCGDQFELLMIEVRTFIKRPHKDRRRKVCVLPVGMDEGVKGESVPPAGREVLNVDAIVAGRLPLTPDQQSLPH